MRPMKHLALVALLAVAAPAQPPEPDVNIVAVLEDTTGARAALATALSNFNVQAALVPLGDAFADTLINVNGVTTLPWTAWESDNDQFLYEAGQYRGKWGRDFVTMIFNDPRGTLHIREYPAPEKQIDLWYMGLCPYGLNALKVLSAPDSPWTIGNLRFVVDDPVPQFEGEIVSLHGEIEVQENIVQKAIYLDGGIDALMGWVRHREDDLDTGPFDPSFTDALASYLPTGTLGEVSNDGVLTPNSWYDSLYSTLYEDSHMGDRFGIVGSPQLVIGGQWVTSMYGLETHFPGCGVDPDNKTQCGKPASEPKPSVFQ